MAKRKAVSKGTGRAKQADTAGDAAGIIIGDYPNSKNIRAWMKMYFGYGPEDTDLHFTFWHMRGELPDISTAADVLRFGLTKGCNITDAGRAKAYELHLLSDDSPAVLLGKRIHKRGCKRTDTPHDKDIYRRHKYGGESYQDIANRFDMDKDEVVKIFWKMDKRQSRTK